jgi:hypothetical protein
MPTISARAGAAQLAREGFDGKDYEVKGGHEDEAGWIEETGGCEARMADEPAEVVEVEEDPNEELGEWRGDRDEEGEEQELAEDVEDGFHFWLVLSLARVGAKGMIREL